MKTSTSKGKHGIYWTARNQLEYFEFTGDLTLLSHTHQQTQVMTTTVEETSAVVSIDMHKRKSKIFEYNTQNTNSITLDGGTLEDVETFTYLDNNVIDE
ncbi:unnamed protein product [Schistosoma margrebowiei]|uniref:Uncharacterized protein n=1 Tax=Schistosoma margrebowiei TaxID=48269 RepID=A0A183LWT9_9TREM|nr:unnamed protein product [Schistosoma margrebowiei]